MLISTIYLVVVLYFSGSRCRRFSHFLSIFWLTLMSDTFPGIRDIAKINFLSLGCQLILWGTDNQVEDICQWVKIPPPPYPLTLPSAPGRVVRNLFLPMTLPRVDGKGGLTLGEMQECWESRRVHSQCWGNSTEGIEKEFFIFIFIFF